ncbi:UNVERIFIED_CONTAM: hypothetical protein Sindi_1481700 [Sesamum indicum]
MAYMESLSRPQALNLSASHISKTCAQQFSTTNYPLGGAVVSFLDEHIGLANALEPNNDEPPEVPKIPLPSQQGLTPMGVINQVMEDVLPLKTASLAATGEENIPLPDSKWMSPSFCKYIFIFQLNIQDTTSYARFGSA